MVMTFGARRRGAGLPAYVRRAATVESIQISDQLNLPLPLHFHDQLHISTYT